MLNLIAMKCFIKPVYGSESLVSVLSSPAFFMDVDQSQQASVVGGASAGMFMCRHQEPLQVLSSVTSLAQVRSGEERGSQKYIMQFWSFLSCGTAGTWVFVIVLTLITRAMYNGNHSLFTSSSKTEREFLTGGLRELVSHTVHIQVHPGDESHLKMLLYVLPYEIIYKTRRISLLLGGVRPPQAIFHISNANVIGRTPGGLAWCRATLEAMFFLHEICPGI